uniref:RNA-directed DNA polymerase n=1 Tax=Fagus sylvatica TaxID=28930 RepID=A0A2N9IKX5_FAGSY
MPPKTRQRRNQGEVSVHTEHSHAESAVNVQGQDQQQPPPSNQNQEVPPTSLLLQLIQSLQQNQSELAEAIKQLKEKDAATKTPPQNEEENQEKPHQDSGSQDKEATFVTMSDVANLLKQEREKNPKEPRLFVRKPPYPIELLKQPYPEKYVVPTFSRFDGRKGSALVHISKFIDSMGAYAGDGDLCLREFSKSLDDRAYTWYTTLPPGSVKTWEDMVELFCGKYFQAEEKVTLVNLHTTKQTNGEDLLRYIHRFRDISLDCYANYEEGELVGVCIDNMLPEFRAHLENLDISRFGQLLQKARKTALSVKPHVEKPKEKKTQPQVLTVSTVNNKRKKPNEKSFEEPPPPVPCTLEEIMAILDKWVADGIIKLPEVSKKATEEDKKNPKFCYFHQYVHHSTADCWTLRRKFHEKIQDGTLELPQARQKVYIDPFLNHKEKGTVSVVIHGNASDVDMDEPVAANSAMTPTAIKALQRNPRFRSLFNQLGLNPEARTAATEAIMAIAADSGAHCFTAETHASRAFLETTNAITFTDEDMEVQYPDHRRPLYLSATINEVQVRRALVDTGSCINLIPLSTIQAAEISQRKIQGAPMEIKGFGGVGEYTKGHIQLVPKGWSHCIFDAVSRCGLRCSLPHIIGKTLAAQAPAYPLHLPPMPLYDEITPAGEASLAKPIGIPLPKWEEIKDAPEADLRDLLERKKKRKAEASASKSQPQFNATDIPESAEAVEAAAADPKTSAKEELEVIDLSSNSNVHRPVSISASLSVEERTHLIELLKEYQDVFAWQYDEMPGIDPKLVAHSLNVEPGTRPVVQSMRTFHPEVEAQITQEVKKLLAAGFIKPIQHPRWLSNIVPVKKKNGQIRCCVDFRNLNKACPKDEFPLPNMDLLIDSAAGHAMFSFMDGFSGYNQIFMSPRDAEKTAFRTPIGNFYYTVMPFGLKNAGATYQRTMTAMFHDMMHREIEDYVDDIVVKSKTREDHFGILKKVFERCRLYKLKMNPLKCAFGVSAGKFLGFLVHQRGIDVDPARSSAIATMKPPTTHKELKSFLGKLSYIRRFIPGLAAVTSTFAPLLKKGASFHWSTECQEAFEKVQNIMTKLPTVCAPIPEKSLRLYLASNSQAIGALIAQENDNGVEQPIYYVSRTLKDAESRYSGAERSCLALIYASQRLRHYFLAHKVQLMTKSHPIRSLLQRPVLSGRLAQWLLQLSQYEITAETPTAIKSQAIADLLAQFPGEDNSFITDEVPGEINEIFLAGLADSVWTLKFDGSSTATSAGAGIVLYKEGAEAVTKSFKFDFPCSNNAAEYEAYLAGLAIAYEMGIKHLRVIGDSNLVVCQARGEFSLKEPSLAPYRALAQKFETKFSTFEIEHAQRNENRYADALATLGSQITFEGEEMDVTICKRVEPITESLKKEFEESSSDQEDWRAPIKAKLISPTVTADLKEIKDYTLISGDLYRRLPGGVLARCISLKEAKERLPEVHEKTCGDGGAISLYRRLQRLGYFWPNMSAEAAGIQSQCPTCQFHYNNEEVCATFVSADWRTPFLEYLLERILPSNPKDAYRLKRLALRNSCGRMRGTSRKKEALPMLTYTRILLAYNEKGRGRFCENMPYMPNLIGPINPASGGCIWILVATEYFTKWVEAIPLRKATGAAVANFIREHIITRFGIPYKLVTDNGTPFINKDVREMLEHYRVKHRRSTPYYPQGNGQAEATNRMLLRILSKMVFDYGNDWKAHLADVLWAYRSSPKTATGFTPFSLVYGTDTISPTELVVPSPRVMQGSELEVDANICAEGTYGRSGRT